jgi:hypothetical protein
VELVDDECRSESPDTVDEEKGDVKEEESLDELRKKYVGEVELPESKSRPMHVSSQLTVAPKVKSRS